MTTSLSEQIEAVRSLTYRFESAVAALDDGLQGFVAPDDRDLAAMRAVLQSLEGMQKLEEAARDVVREYDTFGRAAWDLIEALRAALPDPPAAAETERGDG